MKIYYKQKADSQALSSLARVGIYDCYYKHLKVDNTSRNVTRKPHHHNGFELHIIKEGCQQYEIAEASISLNKGEYLFIPPTIRHKVLYSAPNTEKFSITFTSHELSYFDNYSTGRIASRFFENTALIINEAIIEKNVNSVILIENLVFENIISILRLCGLHETSLIEADSFDDPRLDSVKKYISDNIESKLSVDDIAAYCYLSTKQLSRIFMKYEKISPAQYIANCRISHIQKLLECNDLSIKEISDKMNFQNEYYFNAFVKKHLGMPPGAYRKTIK